jgi:hypothetical protein
VPFFKNASLPFVFCGINWDSTEYGLPCENVTGQNTSDMILVGNAASIDGWEADTARALIGQSTTTVPTGNGDAWMAPFALITFATKPEEQGTWAANTASDRRHGSAGAG